MQFTPNFHWNSIRNKIQVENKSILHLPHLLTSKVSTCSKSFTPTRFHSIEFPLNVIWILTRYSRPCTSWKHKVLENSLIFITHRDVMSNCYRFVLYHVQQTHLLVLSYIPVTGADYGCISAEDWLKSGSCSYSFIILKLALGITIILTENVKWIRNVSDYVFVSETTNPTM